MRNWDTRDESGTDTGCEWEKDWEDVRLVSRHLGIPCRMVRVKRWFHSSNVHRGVLKGRSHSGILE
jgi:tRNA-5-taurinomethyluridine 2-sulfurtransferase